MPTEREVRSIIYNFRKREKALKKHIEELQEELDVYQERPVNESLDRGNTIFWVSDGDLLFITIMFTIVFVFYGFMNILG